GDTANWKGIPAAGGECEVYYDSAKAVIVFDWKGKSTPGSTINWNEDLHGILEKTDILPNLKNNQIFEIDSKCPNSSMVPKVKEQIGSDSLLNNGTWAFLGSSTNKSNRYLFWTSVDTDAVGTGKQIPVIVSSADGGFYISETITATRVNNGQKYVAIADHINSYSTFKEYTKDKTKYETLAEAYAAYKKQVNDNAEFTKYKDTLPE
ncbi:MAG: prepilin-type cleavage/methylation domain-containing protein, partial [Butyricicoccus sp.]